MKSLAHQNGTELGGRGSVLARQKRDHIVLNGLLNRLAASDAEGQAEILLSIYRLVFPHAFAEEAVLWPVMRRLLPDGHELTLQVEIEHQEINELARRLHGLEPGTAERRGLIERMIRMLRVDVRDEEDMLLPSLQARLSGKQLRRLGLAWEIVRRIAPTRPHPVVSRRPPGNLLAALPLAILDRLRDALDRRLARGTGAADPILAALGNVLSRASDTAERLPGMQTGEASETRVRWGRGLTLGAAVASATAALLIVGLTAGMRTR